MVLACGTEAHLSDRRLSGGLLELVAVYARTKPIHAYAHVCVCTYSINVYMYIDTSLRISLSIYIQIYMY